jgi:hypothetical protein
VRDFFYIRVERLLWSSSTVRCGPAFGAF